MPSSGEKSSPVPLKNMDIKSAFLAAGNRKRKASSPTVPKNQSKSLKLSEDKSDDLVEISDNDIEILAECKENTDLNTADSHNILQANQKVSSEDLDSEDKKVCSEKDIQNNSSNESMNEDSAASDELNSSNLNNSVNISELSENIESQNKTESDLNTSVDCNRLTPKSKPRKSSDINETESKPKKKKKMTSEEAKTRAAEREQKNQERLLKKQELEAQKKQKKEELEKRKLQKEQEKKEKEEEKKEKERLRLEKKEQEEKDRLQKLKEKEELKKQRQLMLEQKQEEKKKKEEMRLKLNEEKKKAEEEKKKAEEEKRQAELEKEQKEKEKQEKVKAAFFNFFKKSTPTIPAPQPIESEGAFKPFQVFEDMTLAPVVPAAAQERFDKEKLDCALKQQNEKKLYLVMLKSGKYKDVRQRKRLRQQELSDADVLVLDKKAADELYLPAKLLQFCENLRPPYWGTWRKKSKVVGPRRPYAQDNIFDYEVDSDDEWDEGGPGESLSGTENEVESEDDYEVDHDFFVPHGYLSSDEENEDEVKNHKKDPEKYEAMLQQKQKEFESERKKKTAELKPIILGCFFENLPEMQDSGLRSFFLTYSAEILSESAIPTLFTVKKQQPESTPSSAVNSPTCGSLKKNSVPEEAMPYLIRLVHGNVNNRETLAKEFQSFWLKNRQNVLAKSSNSDNNTSPDKIETEIEHIERKTPTPTSEMTPDTPIADPKNISKRQLVITIKKISTYGKCPNPVQKKSCWWVLDEIREKYGLSDAPIPNEWVMSSISANDTESSSNIKSVASIKEFLIP